MFVIQNLTTGKLFNGWALARDNQPGPLPSWSNQLLEMFPTLSAARYEQALIQNMLPVEQQAKIVVRRIKLDVP